VDLDGSPHRFDSTATIAGPEALISQLMPLIQATEASMLDSRAGFTSPYAGLDAILSGARCLLFDFDGPVCDLTGAMPSDTVERLRGFALDHGVEVPGDSQDPSDIIALAAGHDPGVAGLLDAMLASIELAAVANAIVPGYVHEALAACRDSGRTSAIIGPQSPKAVHDYLEKQGLYDQTGCVVTPGSHPPGHLMTLDYVVESALRALEATPVECALITASPHGVETAFAVGAQPIGYARTPADHERLPDAGATCIISSLADLTLRLRARPLPN
jgi:beta-phosphoglucomutase-like phosphatase (HAD superfamily)